MRGARSLENLSLLGVTVLLAVATVMTAHHLGTGAGATPDAAALGAGIEAPESGDAEPAESDVSTGDPAEQNADDGDASAEGAESARGEAEAAASNEPLCVVVECVALTFDDGPDPQSTTRLLDMLDEEGATASFFMVGRSIATHPQIAQRMVNDGHEVANHSWSHPELNKLGSEGVMRELDRTSEAIEKHTGVRPTLMRPPYGATNGRIEDLINDAGMTQTLWSVDTLDWKHRDPEQTLARIKRDTGPNGVILMHDVHPTTIDSVRSVIAWLRDEGYTLVAASEVAEVIDVSSLDSPA